MKTIDAIIIRGTYEEVEREVRGCVAAGMEVWYGTDLHRDQDYYAIVLRNAPKTVRLHYGRYGVLGCSEHATVRDAARAAINGQENDAIYATKIESRGSVIWERHGASLIADLDALEALAQ